jgi:hypothetical protein
MWRSPKECSSCYAGWRVKLQFTFGESLPGGDFPFIAEKMSGVHIDRGGTTLTLAR